MTNKKVAAVLNETAQLIELTGGNPFRARAFSSAARTIRDMEEPLQDYVDRGALQQIDGIGDGLAAQLNDLFARASFDLRDELLNAVPPGLLDVLRVKGLGTKRVRTLWKELDVTSLDELETAAESNQIQQISGFGAKTEANILKHVRALRRYDAQRRYADVYAAAHSLRDTLAGATSAPVALAGGFRRKCPTLQELTLVSTADARALVDALNAAEYESASASDKELPPYVRATVTTTLPDGFPVSIYCVHPDELGTALWYHTGSESYRKAMTDAPDALPAMTDEAAVFASFDSAPHPPELREALWTDTLAALPDTNALITLSDLRGTLHNHTTYSDGAHSLRAMAEATRSRGLEYIGICDHSQSLTVASGLSPDEVRAQHDAIDALNDAHDDGTFRVFKGIESDILKDGSLDYDDELLAQFDLVVASVHSGFSMNEAEATERIIRAVSHPATTILGHPTGRLLLVREGYPIDHEAVIDACAAHNVAIELNANPYRLDVDWTHVRYAVEQGVLVSINPDAHSTDELDNVRWGVEAARKGGLTADACLNAKSLPDFEQWLDARAPVASTA
ncbi:MAG: helix-hairpin-helix domain-containing protein [Longimonas sp.]|uniref:helix-hairpin-helix domain-containing protein n=1 Tax=Longimonas sp. TaxID=2039626 RepID=UPI00334459FF